MWTDLDQLRAWVDRFRNLTIPRLYAFTLDQTEQFERDVWMAMCLNTYRLERALGHDMDLGGEG